jgi:RHS repeat-associated protein
MSLRTCQSDPRFVGDPIDVTTGANTDIITDLAQRGPLPFRWTRYYNSARSKTRCSLGWGHSHHFDCLLIRDLEGLRYEDPFGSVIGFQDPGDGPDSIAGGMSLKRLGQDSYVASRSGRPDQEFRFTPGSDVARVNRLRQGALTIELRYHGTGALREIVDSRGRLIRITSDSAGRILKLALFDAKAGQERDVLLTYEYDGAGNLVRATDLYNTRLSFAYDAANRMIRRTDRRGYSFHFEYDDKGRCIHSRGDDGLLEVFLDYEPEVRTTFVRRGDGGQWIYAYDENKVVTQITDPYGHATKFILDERGRPVQEIDPSGNVTTLHYDWRGGHDFRIDPNGNLLPTKEANPNPADPLTYQLPTTALEWDFGRRIPAANIASPNAHDPLLARVPAPVVDAVLGKTGTHGPTTHSPEPTHGRESEVTNDFDMLLERTSPQFTETWKYDANGNEVEHRDRDGRVYRSIYNSWNSLWQSIDPLGNATTFEITVQGHVAKITDPGGMVTEYEYDLRDQLVQVREAGGYVERYRLDPAGNIVEKIDASGQTQARWEFGPGNLPKAAFFASGEKHLYEYNDNGRLTKAQTPAGVATFVYDEDANLIEDKRDGKGVTHEIKWRRLQRTTYFDKFKVSYRTLENGDLVIEDPTGAKHRFQFGRTGLVLKHLRNGTLELSQYDAHGRCSRKALMRGDGKPLWMHGYGYSAAGDLISIADTYRGTTRYRHDAAHRILEETGPDGTRLHFEHDRAGNVVRQPGLSDVVIGAANRIQEVNGGSCTYTIRGHLRERRNGSLPTRYTYDDREMLVQCDLQGEKWTASYDGTKRRVQKTWRGEATAYYWDDWRLAAELRHNGSVRLYVYADHKALAPFLFIEYESMDAAPESGRRLYVFTNQVAAPIRVEDDGGRTVWSAQLGPYGAARIDPSSTIDMPLRFPGHYFDRETGLHYNRNRYYSPELGRYLQTDPAGLAGGINAYGYRSDPLTAVDIDGLGLALPHTPTKRNPAPHKVGCPDLAGVLAEKIDVSKGEEHIKKEMEAKMVALHLAIEEAKKNGATHLKLPNKQVLDIRNKSIGPCLSVALDKRTGNTTYGQNVHHTEVGQKGLHPDAFTKEDKKKLGTKKPTPRTDAPGTHSEVQAVSQGMKDRDEARKTDPSLPPAEKKDFAVYNESTGLTTGGGKSDKPRGTPMKCCDRDDNPPGSGCKQILGTAGPGEEHDENKHQAQDLSRNG